MKLSRPRLNLSPPDYERVVGERLLVPSLPVGDGEEAVGEGLCPLARISEGVLENLRTSVHAARFHCMD